MVIGIIGGIGSGKSTVTHILKERYGFTALILDDIARELESPGEAVYESLVREFGRGILEETEPEEYGRGLYCGDAPAEAGGREKEGPADRAGAVVLKPARGGSAGREKTAPRDLCIGKGSAAGQDVFRKGLEVEAGKIQPYAGAPIDKAKFAARIYSDKEALRKANAIIHPAVWEYAYERSRGADDYVIETALPRADFHDMCDRVWYVHTERKVRISRLMASRDYTEGKCASIMDNQMGDAEYEALADDTIDNSSIGREAIEELAGTLLGRLRPGRTGTLAAESGALR